MNILFTGHRNAEVDEQILEYLMQLYPEAIWMAGGAEGFDTQVELFAIKHGIRIRVICPDYSTGRGERAPLDRDRDMVDMADLVVACYDGRLYGGTLYTISYAVKKHVPVLTIKPSRYI